MLAATDMDANINSSQKMFARELWLRLDSQAIASHPLAGTFAPGYGLRLCNFPDYGLLAVQLTNLDLLGIQW